MRSTLHGKTDFLKKMKRKPAQEVLYQKAIALDLTEEEIESCGQALWFRDALREIVARGGRTQSETVQFFIDSQILTTPEFPTYIYKGKPREVIPKKSMSLELETNDHILHDPSADTLKINYITLFLDSATITGILAESEYVGDNTHASFIELF